MDKTSQLIDRPSADLADEYLKLAMLGLTQMYDPNSAGFPQTARLPKASTSPSNLVAGQPELALDGHSVRDTAIAALGIVRLQKPDQRTVLSGFEAADLVVPVTARALAGTDPGAVALTTWLAAECGAEIEAARGVRKIRELIGSRTPIPTVDQSWMLTALVEYGISEDLRSICEAIVDRLLRHQHRGGIFPHVLPPRSQATFRSHLGYFADQVAAIQALARYAAASGDHRALAAANRCARRVCQAQGTAGQWWWRYDTRTSEVVQEYPVYSVHQHALAPMALFDLAAAGGENHRPAVAKGLNWVASHPEVPVPLVDSARGLIWRKVGRREPAQARAVRAATTAIRPGFRLRALDPIFPPTRIDYQCRPSELGWLLYAWSRNGGR